MAKTLVDHRLRDQAVTACCLAAAAVSDRTIPDAQRGALLMDCLGVLIAAHPISSAPTMATLRQGLFAPMRGLLPPGVAADDIGEVVLLDDHGQLRDEGVDLGVEFLVPRMALSEHWTWAKVSAEQEERRTFEILRRLPTSEYSRVRELLVRHASGEIGQLRRVWDGKLSQLEPYEPINEWTWCQVRGHWFACPICRWPMRVNKATAVWEVRCEAHARDGIVYLYRPDDRLTRAPKLLPSGLNAPSVKALPATPEHYALSRPHWRYMTLPGLLELAIRDHARRLKARVVMWPHKDRYDVKITLNRRVWKIDAKAWVSATKLGDSLKDSDPAEPGMIIVIPDHLRTGRDLLQHMIGPRGYRVLTFTGLLTELDEAKAGQR